MSAFSAGGVCTACHRALDDHSFRKDGKWIDAPICPTPKKVAA